MVRIRLLCALVIMSAPSFLFAVARRELTTATDGCPATCFGETCDLWGHCAASESDYSPRNRSCSRPQSPTTAAIARAVFAVA